MTRITVKITYSLVMKNCRGRAQKAVEALASVTSVKARYARVSKATDGLRQAFMDELVASLA